MPDPGTDPLSPLTHEIIRAAAYEKLVAPSHPPAPSRDLLGHLTADQLLIVPITDQAAASAMLAGLWLWHDALEESHRISQLLHTDTGSFWHAIMHRREGDFSNAKYWNARCRSHPVLTALTQNAGAVLNPLPADKRYIRLTAGGSWNADAFVDLVEAVHEDRDEPAYQVAVRLQQLEWRLLFEHCVRAAAGN